MTYPEESNEEQQSIELSYSVELADNGVSDGSGTDTINRMTVQTTIPEGLTFNNGQSVQLEAETDMMPVMEFGMMRQALESNHGISLFEITDVNNSGPYYSGNEQVFRVAFGLTEETGTLSNTTLQIKIPRNDEYINPNNIRGSELNIADGDATIITTDPDYYIVQYK